MNPLIHISEAASLAFHGLALISAQSPERLSMKEAAEKLQASEAHLAKVFQTLSKAGIVRSKRGPQGGFVLNHPPSEINFLTVYEAIESPVKGAGCPLAYSHCGFHDCIFTNEMHTINQNILTMFQNITLDRFSPVPSRNKETL